MTLPGVLTTHKLKQILAGKSMLKVRQVTFESLQITHGTVFLGGFPQGLLPKQAQRTVFYRQSNTTQYKGVPIATLWH